MRSALTLLGVLAVIGYSLGCGKPELEGLTEVDGTAVFGSQCPYGTLSKPFATPLYLWDCPIGLKKLELVQPLRPIILQADCKKKLIVARTLDGVLDTVWEVMPDGTFNFTVDGGYAVLRDDNRGNPNCSIRLAADISGRLECGDRDRVKITVESVWWLDKVAPAPTARPSPMPSVVPTATPTSTPTIIPTVLPTETPTPVPTGTPVPTPTVIPTFTPVPTPTVTVVPTVRPTATPTSRPVPIVTVTPRPPRIPAGLALEMLTADPSGPKCSVPTGCYFYSSADIQQCE